MRNFKKILNSVLAVLLVMGTLSPAINTASAAYSAELESAYEYAKGIGITTMPTIDDARMYDELTRAEMAKMMVTFLTTVKGDTIVAKDGCDFPDLGEELGDLKDFATQACYAGLMGVGVDNFRPYDKVTRAAFGTVMSRALWGEANNTTTPDRYTKHLEALKVAGIMNNITNPMMPEIRGYVMIMMKRADDYLGNDLPEECQDPMVQLSCALGLDDCPEVCLPEEPVTCEDGYVYDEVTEECVVDYQDEEQGTLSVDLASAQPQDKVPTDVIAVEIGTLEFSAGNDEDVILDSITMEALGYGDFRALDDVAIYDDRGIKVSRERDVDSEGEVKLSFINGYVVKAGGREKLTVTAKIVKASTSYSDVQNGDTFGFEVTAVDGPVSISGLPVSTQLVEVVTVNNKGILGITDGNEASADVKIGEAAKL